MTDQSRLETLFRQHYHRMYRLAAALLHDEAEGKDVVHDIFAQLLGGPHILREETAETYLLTCVRNRCLNVMRSRQLQERVARLYLLEAKADQKSASQETEMPSPLQLEAELAVLSEAVGQLEPPVCRDIIVQHFHDGMTFKEIARRLGVSETTVYKHLRRALSQLRTHLQNPMSV